MEQTKIYLLIEDYYGCYGSKMRTVLGFYTSQDEAEYRKYQLDNGLVEDSYSSSRYSYHVEEALPGQTDKTDMKAWKRFIQKKVERIESDIRDKETCKENDIKAVSELSKQLDAYKTQL